MKTFFLCLLLLLIPVISSFASAQQDYLWFCMQPGSILKDKVMLLTQVHYHKNNGEQAKKHFDFMLKKDIKDWVPQYDPQCISGKNIKQMTDLLKKIIMRAKKQGFHIIYLNLEEEK